MNKTTQITILAFGIARDIVGGSQFLMEVPESSTVENLQALILEKYPQFHSLASIRLAVNSSYAMPEQPISASDEIAIIPPVSGG